MRQVTVASSSTNLVSEAVCGDDYHLPVPSGDHVTGWIPQAARNMAGQRVQAALQGDDDLRHALLHYQPHLQAVPLPESENVSTHYVGLETLSTLPKVTHYEHALPSQTL